MSRSPGKALVNGLPKEDPRCVTQLERQLSDKQRQLLLSQQLVKQLDKIRKTHNELQDVSTRLVRQRVDIDLDDKEEFDRLTNEVKKLEAKLKVLRSVEQNGVDIDVHLMPYKKIRGNKYLVADREVSLGREGIGRYKSGDRGDSSSDTEEEDSPDYKGGADRYRKWSGSTDLRPESRSSGTTINTGSVADEARELNLRRKRSGRRTVIPERFASFPKGYAGRDISALGLIGVVLMILVGALIAYYAFNANDNQLPEVLIKTKSYLKSQYEYYRSAFGW